MSYDIIYDRQFIKSPAGITPLVLVGCNNVTERTLQGRERRVRDWSPFFNTPAIAADELIRRTQDCCGGHYQEHFKRGGKWVDDQAFVRFIKYGIQSARTLEEIRTLKPGISLICYLSVWRKTGEDDCSNHELFQTVHTTEALLSWIESARKRIAEKQENESIYYSMRFPSNEPLKLPPVSHITGPVAARRGRDYIAAISDHSISTCFDAASALIFESAEDAWQRIPTSFHGDIRLCRAEGIAKKREWRHIIQVTSGSHAGSYVDRLTRSRLRMTLAQARARRFSSKCAAQRYIDQMLTPRISYCSFAVDELPPPAKDEHSERPAISGL